MSTIARMNVMLGLDSTDFDRGVKDAKSSTDSLLKGMSKVGGAMTGALTLPILGMAAASVKLSNDLNKSMANIGSLGIGTDRLKEMKKGIQDLSIEVGASTEDIADGMYQVVSAFGDGADSMKILRTNAKLAKAGLSSTSEAIALTSAVTKGYNDTTAEAVTHTADLAIQTVALGQTTFPELASAIGTVTPLAASLGVAQEDLFAVMATGAGVTGTTSQVATQFRGVLQSLMAPTDSMTKLFKKLGYSNGEAMLKGEGLQGTLDAIVKTAENAGAPLTDYIGSIEGVTLALALTGAQHETLTKNMTAMQDVAGAADDAFLAQTQGLNKVGFSMDQLQRYSEVLGQKLGDGLAPALAIVLDKVMPLADGMIALVDQFAKMDNETQGWILAGIGIVAALGPLLLILPGIAKGVAAVAGAMAVMSGPIGLVILAVAALGVAWATNWGGIQEKTAAVWQAIEPTLTTIITKLQTMQGINFADFAGGLKALSALAGVDLKINITPTVTTLELPDSGLKLEVKPYATTITNEAGGMLSVDVLAKTLTIDPGAALPALAFKVDIDPESQKTIDAILGAGATGGAKGFGYELGQQTRKELDKEIASLADMLKLNFGITFGGKATLDEIVKEQQISIKTVETTASWKEGTQQTLFDQMQAQFKEPIMLAGSWFSNVLGDLWSQVQAQFNLNPINVLAKVTTVAAQIQGPVDSPARQAASRAIGENYGMTAPPQYNGWDDNANGGFAQGWSVVGERGPELAFFGGDGARILSNPDSLKFLESLGLPGFADGTGPVPPIGPKMAPGGYAVQDRPAGLLPPIMTKLTEAADAMSNAGESLMESATVMGESTEAFRSALQNVPGLFKSSEVTADQMRQAEMGIPQEFADNYLRRLTDEVVNGVDWEGVDIGDAAAAAGIDPNLPAEAILELFKAAWNDSSLFSNPENLKFIDQSAVKAAIQKQQDQLAGQMNILALFGIKDENIATQVEGLGTILSTNFQDQMTPELFNPVGTKMVESMAGGFASAGAAGTASGNMVGAIQTALTQADMKDKLMTSGESAAAIYWDGWMNFFSKVNLPVPEPPGGGSPATPPGGKAAGGPVSSGVPYIVGERGQELFVPNVNGRIIPNDELGGMWDMSSMGGGDTPMIGVANVYNQVDIRALSYQVAEYMARRR